MWGKKQDEGAVLGGDDDEGVRMWGRKKEEGADKW
jgi:hypothetical protein